MPLDWDHYWHEALDETKERSPQTDPEDYYRSGRKSKAFPDKENPDWWGEKGPGFVKSWVQWRDLCGLVLWEYPDENGVLQPAIELEVWAHGPNDLKVRCFIDRVLQSPETGELYIVDLKTGSQTPAWPLQLALNNLALRDFMREFCDGARWGGFWKARSGGISPDWFDLSIYTDEWLWEQVRRAKEIRDQGLFVAQPTNLCNTACGVREWCLAMGGRTFIADATLTHHKEGTA